MHLRDCWAEKGGWTIDDDLRAAGILVTADGPQPSSCGKRVAFDGAARTAIGGPFAGPP